MKQSRQKALEDHIFGDINQRENIANWLEKRFQGLRHYQEKSPLIPGPGEEVELTATTTCDQSYDALFLWYTSDEWKTQEKRQFERGELIWYAPLWTYLQVWKVSIPAQEDDAMVWYKIGGRIEGSNRVVFADNQAETFKAATNFSIWYGTDSLPEWAKDAIVYQIFVDRFSPGEGKAWKNQEKLREHFGGTLKGITEKLPYIQSMGFNAVWLTPIFESPSHHAYDTTDYRKIKSAFGSDDDFKELVDTAHDLGLRVILDFVANHCSNKHANFQDAFHSQESQYHDWFIWKPWPDYECFFNVRRMPKLDLAHGKPARKYLLESAQYWLKKGVDGFRLDYAHGPEQDFWVDFRKACSQVKDDVWTFGEIVQPPDVQQTYGGGLWGALDFVLCQVLRETFGLGSMSLESFSAFISSHDRYLSKEFSFPSFIDNHDMNRFLFLADNDNRKLKLALLVLYCLPGPPIIYYGTEALLSQNQSIHAKEALGFDEARLAMPWDQAVKASIPGYLSRLAEIRKQFPAIHQQPWGVVQFDPERDMIALGKRDSRNFLLLINRSEKGIQVVLPIRSHRRYKDLIGEDTYKIDNGKLRLLLPACSSLLLTAL